MERDYDWTVPDEHFLPLNIFIPSLAGAGAGEIVVVGDESGSINQKMREVWGGHFKRVLESCEPERMHILHTSTKVAHISTFDECRPFTKYENYTTGGTDMGEGVRVAAEKFPHADVCIVLTDGFTPWGKPPPMPVVWLITNKHKVAPYGTTIHCDLTT
jgi:predicted metal-dependent peptidase